MSRTLAILAAAAIILAAACLGACHRSAGTPPCQGDTAAAPCAVVTRDDGTAVEWTTNRGD